VTATAPNLRSENIAMRRTTLLPLLAASASVLAVGLLLLHPASATEAIGKTTNLECTVCHDKPGSKLLTDQGKYYELFGSFDGYQELAANFGECTVCHSAKPGSQKLTRAGKQFQRAFADMADLRAFVMKQHPVPVAPPLPAEPPQNPQP
jgi:hypothetical protein